MQKKTKLLFLEMFVALVLFGLLLYFVDSYDAKPKEDTFTAYVAEVFEGAVNVVPFPDEKLARSYTLIMAPITGVSPGDVIQITYGAEVRETHPASIDVIRYSVIMRNPIKHNNIEIPEENHGLISE